MEESPEQLYREVKIMSGYDSKTAKSMPINVDRPNYYPGANVYPSAHNTGSATNARSDGKSMSKGGGSYAGHSMKKKAKMSRTPAHKY